MTVTASGTTLAVNLDGDSRSYPNGTGAFVSQIRARLHGGGDNFDAATVTKSAFVLGGDGGDVLRGSKTGDLLRGGAGDDVLLATAANDTLDGGLDVDSLIGANSNTTWNITGANSGGTTAGMSFVSIESLLGGSGNDRFQMGVDAGISGGINGGSGSNTLVGAAQVNYWSISGANSGVLNDDSFTSIQSVIGGSQADLFAMESDGSLALLDGGTGADTLDYSSRATTVSVNLATKAASSITTMQKIESLVGGSSADLLVGANVANTWRITSADGGSVGGVAFDSFENLTGGSANDRFVFSSHRGVAGAIDGGAGVNAVDYSAYIAAVAVNLATGAATNVDGGIVNIHDAFGGAGADTLTGNAAANVLMGNAGNDTLVGGGGHDRLVGGTGHDRLTGGADRSLLIGGRGVDTILGGASDDLLIGGSTSLDANLNALAAILAEWTRADLGYIDRINHLRGTVGGGLNGSTLLTPSTVRDDAVADSLTGAGGLDWFWATVGDTTDLETGELIG